NAGMYDLDERPVGLYVESGRELVRVNTRAGPGNFHMRPNGVLFVAQGFAGVMETRAFLRQKPQADFATQSGPMLVMDGRLHPRFARHGGALKYPRGVGRPHPATLGVAGSGPAGAFRALPGPVRGGAPRHRRRVLRVDA